MQVDFVGDNVHERGMASLHTCYKMVVSHTKGRVLLEPCERPYDWHIGHFLDAQGRHVGEMLGFHSKRSTVDEAPLMEKVWSETDEEKVLRSIYIVYPPFSLCMRWLYNLQKKKNACHIK